MAKTALLVALFIVLSPSIFTTGLVIAFALFILGLCFSAVVFLLAVFKFFCPQKFNQLETKLNENFFWIIDILKFLFKPAAKLPPTNSDREKKAAKSVKNVSEILRKSEPKASSPARKSNQINSKKQAVTKSLGNTLWDLAFKREDANKLGYKKLLQQQSSKKCENQASSKKTNPSENSTSEIDFNKNLPKSPAISDSARVQVIDGIPIVHSSSETKKSDFTSSNEEQQSPNGVLNIFNSPFQDIHQDFLIFQLLGSGSFGDVHSCLHLHSGREFAKKTLGKEAPNFDVESVSSEINMLRTVGGHPGIVTMRYLYEDDKFIHLVLDLCKYGSVYDRMSMARGPLPLVEALIVFQQTVSAVKYCHEKGVIHRDIKIENVLVSKTLKRDGAFVTKLSDFGLARRLKEGEKMRGFAGSLSYMAPEVLWDMEYGLEADIWSLGVLFYVMIFGKYPFAGETRREIMNNMIHQQEIDFKGRYAPDLIKDLILMMLDVNPQNRPSLRAIENHPLIAVNVNIITSTMASDFLD